MQQICSLCINNQLCFNNASIKIESTIMEELITASVTINQKSRILGYNKQFADLFLHNAFKQNNQLTFDQIIDYPLKIQECKKNGLLIKNNLINNQDMLSYFYINVTKTNHDSYMIKFINWLNWIANLYSSLNYSYDNMISLSDRDEIKVEYSSDIHAFNAFFPLLMHKPANFIKQINTHALYGILRKFINRKNVDYISRDYTKQTYSRLETSIKEQTGNRIIELIEIMKNREILNFRHFNQIYICNTKITKTIFLNGYTDELLNLYLTHASI